jgi:hypothetical protein
MLSVQFPALDAVAFAMEINGKRVLVAAYSAPQEMTEFIAVVQALIATMDTYEYVIPQSADVPITVGDLGVSIAGTWDTYQFALDPIRINNLRGTLFERDSIFITIYPTLATLSQFTGYDVSTQTVGDTTSIPLFFSAIAQVQGADITPIQSSSVGGKTLSVVGVNPTDNTGTTLLYYTVADGDDFLTVQFVVRRGYANDWQPFILDFLTKIRKSG